MATLAVLEAIAWAALHKKWPRTPGIPTNEWVILTGHGRRLKPNLDFKQNFVMSGLEVRFRTNSLGFRGPEMPAEKSPGEKRVLVLGDSITLAAYLPEDQIFTSLVQDALSASGPVRVVNAGVYDAGLQEEIYVLKESGLKIKPDVVLLGFYLNDSRPPWGFENEYYRLPPRLMEFSKTAEQYSYLYQWLWKRILVTHFIGRKMADRLNWQTDYQKNDWMKNQDAYRHLISQAPRWTGAQPGTKIHGLEFSRAWTNCAASQKRIISSWRFWFSRLRSRRGQRLRMITRSSR